MILFGASGHGKVIADILNENGITDIEFWDDAPGANLADFRVVKTPLNIHNTGREIIISIGNNAARKVVAERLGIGHEYQTAIHPSTVVSKSAFIDCGSVLMGGATVNIDTRIGRHSIINTNASVDHDCIIGDYVHISPNVAICGGVTVGEGTHIGAGSVVIPGITIGKWCTVGAGSVIIRDVPDYATAVGNPARVIKYLKA